MSDSKQKFYLTTPIYYVNARPHIGHAYTTIVADVLARRHRLLGDDTFFLTGTDEHGQKIERSAAAAGMPPQQFADEVSASFEALWKRMGITNDAYIRTTDEKHKKGAQKLFATLYEKGFIYLDSYTGAYCVSDETFVDVTAGEPCPDCGRITETVTEENFFFKLSDFQLPLLDLIEGGELKIENDARRNEVLSFLRGNVKAVFDEYKLAQVQYEPASPTQDAYQSRGSDGIVPAGPDYLHLSEELEKSGVLRRTKEAYYVPGTLKDLSISRSSFTWGIPVPEPAASAAAQKHVIYVWLDALANYMTAIGYGSDEPVDEEQFKKYWPADLHLVGKEIIRFHCVYWPAFLLAADLPLPKAITAHGWLLFDNSKMSKSKGNIVRTETILDAFGHEVYGKQFPDSTKSERDLFASDVLRYFLLREIPFGQDGSFSFDALITRYNADLANGYGNLVNRTLTMIEANFSATIPIPPKNTTFGDEPIPNGKGGFLQDTGSLRRSVLRNAEAYRDFMETRDLSIAVSAPMASISATDRYLSDHTPWKLAKETDEESRQKLSEILFNAAASIRIITVLLYPILPFATAKVWAQLGLGDIELVASDDLRKLAWDGLKSGKPLGPLAPIFPRADKGLAQIMTDMENPTPAIENTPTPTTEVSSQPERSAVERPAAEAATGAKPELSPEITIDDFAKIELRVAQITLAERIPKADKLLRLEVDLGTFGQRQILSGIAEWYTPEELIGRRIVVITNLAPRKMRGLESHGMLLAASEEGGKPILTTFGEDIALGSRLK